MTSLAQAIRTFQSSGASRDEFLTLVDNALSVDDTSTGRLLEILREEQARTPLPADLYAAVHRRIEQASLASHGANSDETRLQTSPGALQQRVTPPAASQSAPPARDFVMSETDQVKEVGDTLNGRFVLEECLGVGGMGTVYKALDLRKLEASDRRPYIAIKVLNLQFRGNPKSLIALQREAKKAQALGHRNIVTVYDFDRDGPVVYLTMEYLSGKPLSRILRAPEFKGMPYAQALPIFTGMANALAYAHERGFVHCDFKPANVFLTDTAEVKVIDFGIARVFQRPEEETDATIFDPGSLGALTPAYASPEMLEHREPDPRDDIYATRLHNLRVARWAASFRPRTGDAGARFGPEAAASRWSGHAAVAGAQDVAGIRTVKRACRLSRAFCRNLAIPKNLVVSPVPQSRRRSRPVYLRSSQRAPIFMRRRIAPHNRRTSLRDQPRRPFRRFRSQRSPPCSRACLVRRWWHRCRTRRLM